MISSLNGKIISKAPDEIVIECSGIGFSVSIPAGMYSSVGNVGDDARIFTRMIVKEDAMELYGFSDVYSRECFDKLITVSGIGPRSALSVLSMYTPDKVSLAVASGDYKAFTACSGIGTKIAQRLVLELKGKMPGFGSQDVAAVSGMSDTVQGASSDAIAALVALGFGVAQATAAVAKLPQDLSVDQMLNAALKSMDKR